MEVEADQYGTYADPLEEAARGRTFRMPIYKPGKCSASATLTSFLYYLPLIRGYALYDAGGATPPEWLGHWWVMSPEGKALDTAWGHRGLAYLGAPDWLEARRDDDDRFGAFTSAGAFVPYLERKQAEGKSKREAIRCLKRLLARTVFNTLKASPSPAAFEKPRKLRRRSASARTATRSCRERVATHTPAPLRNRVAAVVADAWPEVNGPRQAVRAQLADRFLRCDPA
jgi:hypothetical protein